MKKFTFITIGLFFTIFLSFSQEYSYKFGEVTLPELQMDKYPFDSTAQAVVIYKMGNTHYKFVENRLQIESHYETKIKILNSEGTAYANVEIPFYEEKGWNILEYITDVEAYAYNYENGENTCTKLEKKYIFEERVSPCWKRLKFSIPAVKAGTVIEYRYTRISFIHNALYPCQIQEFIPVIYAHYEILIPEHIRFHARIMGLEPIQTEEQNQKQEFDFRIGNNKTKPILSNSRRLKFTATYVPALDKKNFLWCLNDYITGVEFEFQGIRFPSPYYPPYTASWENVDKTLKKSYYFGKYLSVKNPYQKEMKKWKLDSLDNKEKTKYIFRYLQNKITWDGNYSLGSDGIKEVVKNGRGSNADFNFILLSMLRDAGIPAYPLLLRLRQLGEISLTWPEISNFTTFIVGVPDTDSSFIYMDGSMTQGDVNILSPVFLVKQARVLDLKNGSYWTAVNPSCHNGTSTVINVTLDKDGNIQGTYQNLSEGIFALSSNIKFTEKKDSMDFIKQWEIQKDIKIDSFRREGIGKAAEGINKQIFFHKPTKQNGRQVYLNPMIFPHLISNPFTVEKCNLPVEFDFPYTHQINVNLSLPDNYIVEEISQSDSIMLEGKGASYSYQCTQEEGKIKLRYIFSLDKKIYQPEEYPLLKKFWEAVLQKNNEQIVLKRTGRETL